MTGLDLGFCQNGDSASLPGSYAPGIPGAALLWLCRRRIFMVNLPRGQEVPGLHGVRSLFQGAILRLVRLYGLSVQAYGERLERH